MLINGIDLDGLGADAPASLPIPDPVPGRIVHIDADFLAYMMSAEKVDGSDPKTFDDMKHNTEVFVDTVRSLAGATGYHLHLTPSTSDKGDRYDLAIQKQYQGNRIDKPKPRYLHILREWMSGRFPATMHQDCEADDGMSSMQYAAINRGERNLSIIASKDKDLNMVPGLHLDWDTGIITDADDFGHTHLHDRNGTKVLKGYGQKFFWAQMLMGDTADNTQGLPKLPGHVLNKVKPTKETEQLLAVLNNPEATTAHKDRAQKWLDKRAPAPCGPVVTQAVMELLPDNATAFAVVKSLYKAIGESLGFKHWKTGEPVPWQRVFVSEGQLHWMRRVKNDPLDVARWWQEIAA